MATAVLKKEQQISTCEVFLKGRVAPHVQANIIKEMVKHLMFQRNQIPMTYEQMKFEHQRQERNQERSQSSYRSTRPRSRGTGNVTNDEGKPKRRHKLPCMAQRRLDQLIDSVEEQLANIDTLFTLSLVPHVLILFGPTAVSPKEVHEIVFRNQSSVHDSSLSDMRTKQCMRELMRTLIADSNIWEAKQLPLTNTLLLIRAHRDSGLSWFQPKVMLKVPTRGHLYRCEIHCGHVAPQDCPHANTEENDAQAAGEVKSPAENNDYIWYQAPVPIKGIHAFASNAAAENDIWA